MCENKLGQHYNAISLTGVEVQAQHGWKVKKLTEKEACGYNANTQLHKSEALLEMLNRPDVQNLCCRFTAENFVALTLCNSLNSYAQQCTMHTNKSL